MRDSETDFSHNDDSPDRNLLSAVLHQAWIDAFDMESGGVTMAERAETRRWLSATYGPFFKDRTLLLNLIGIDPVSFAERVARQLTATESAWQALQQRYKAKEQSKRTIKPARRRNYEAKKRARTKAIATAPFANAAE